jgi:hypothetical protein
MRCELTDDSPQPGRPSRSSRASFAPIGTNFSLNCRATWHWGTQGKGLPLRNAFQDLRAQEQHRRGALRRINQIQITNFGNGWQGADGAGKSGEAARANLEGYVRSPARGLGVTEGDLT